LDNAENPGLSEFQSLAILIGSHMSGRWADVPAKLQDLIRTRCPTLALCWDNSDASGRMRCATHDDWQHAPANEAENHYWRQLIAQIWHAEERKHQLELTNPQGIPSEVGQRMLLWRPSI
jgi:hypothetical protein